MDRYIEVVGEGRFEERAARFIAEVTLEVRAAKEDVALRELSELRSEALSVLHDAGIADTEIVEGGTDLLHPWYWKKKLGQNASRKIILKVEEFGRLNSALERLEPLQSKHLERRIIRVDMRQPEFEETGDAKAKVLAQAYGDAKAKASHLAAAMGCALGQPLHVEERGWAKRNSGFSGDEDWGGDSSRFTEGHPVLMLAAGGAAGEPEQELLRPTRTVFVKCRVRFALDGP